MAYWDMTFKEIKASIEGYSKRSETDMRVNAVIAYQHARVLSHQIGIVFGSKDTQKQIYEAFPGIFPHLEQQAALSDKKQQNWKIMKQRIEEYAAEKRKWEVKQSDNNNREITNINNE